MANSVGNELTEFAKKSKRNGERKREREREREREWNERVERERELVIEGHHF